jgi:TM2 domain-containing membrane protein YozV
LVAALWSVFIPGFGQFYVRDYITGLVLITFEIVLNLLSNLNLAIHYSFLGQFERARSVVNYEYGLFYPSVYVYNIWHAYNYAKEINEGLKEQGVKKPKRMTSLTGLLYGFGLGMFFGLHFQVSNSVPFFQSPVFNGLLVGIVGVIIGYLIEKLFTFKKF